MAIDNIKVAPRHGGGYLILDVDTEQAIHLGSREDLFSLVAALREATVPKHTWTKAEIAAMKRSMIRVGRSYPKGEWVSDFRDGRSRD